VTSVTDRERAEPYAEVMNATTTIRDIAVAIPGSVRVFEKYQIDFCCNGKRPLDQACQEQGLSADAVLAEIAALGASASAPERDWTRESLTALIGHIVDRHHVYLRRELPQIEARVEKVVANHGASNPNLHRVREVFLALRDELMSHMMKEENILFPFIQQMEAGRPGPSCFGTVANPIRMMHFEHDNAGAALAEMRQLTNGFAAPESGCAGFRALMHDLSGLEADLHQHIHLENNLLFPRALELEQAVMAR
jgi:regulator of cell morphogenesis and NO signaling